MTLDQANTEEAAAHPPLPRPRAREGWQLAGSIPENYERYLVPAVFRPWAERLVDLAAAKPGEFVLDVACGTGIVARQAAARVRSGGMVVGLDVSPAMLEVAAAAAADVRPVIGWQLADAAEMPFPEAAFEVVLCQQGLQFFSDQPAALGEMRRVLAPGGRLALAVWRPVQHAPGFEALTQALERHAGAEIAAIMRPPFAGPDAEGLRQLATDAGLEDVRCQIGIGAARFPSPEQFLRQQTISSPLAGPVAALDANVLDKLIRDLTQALQPHLDDDGVTFPIQTWLLTAHR